MHPNVWLLMLAQAFMGAIGPVVVFVGGFVGLKLAPDPGYATLPIACMIVGVAFFMLPAVKLLASLGRKHGFILAAVWGALTCLAIAYSIFLQNFWLFCLAIFSLGFTIATSQQFRFAAMESVKPEAASEAISVMLLAGLIAAYMGPEIAFLGKDLFQIEFIGSFAVMAILYIPAALLLSRYQEVYQASDSVKGSARSLSTITKQPIFIVALLSATVAFSVMSFIMTATPISMHVHHAFDMEDTKWVIQSHIIAMYLPSFFTGLLVKRFGHSKMIISGVIIFCLCLVIGYLGKDYVHYWASLVLLGVGWNFMFISATSLLPQSYEPEERFRVQGFNDLIMFSCQAIASLSAGWVIKAFGWNNLLLVCVPLLLLVLWAMYVWYQKNKNTKIS